MAGPPAARPAATEHRPTVVVVGAGIAGLSAAWELTGGGRADPRAPSVLVLEASSGPGGKLGTQTFDGQLVDVGPDGFLGRRPEAVDLCTELGLAGHLEPIGASGAAVWARGRRRPLPDGLFLGIPTRVWPVARSGILSPAGTLRLLRDVVAPRPDLRGPLGDRALGPLIANKLGHQVVDRLVDPLLGGIYAGGVADASAAAVLPAVLPAAQRRAGFMRALRRAAGGQAAAPGPPPPAAAAAGDGPEATTDGPDAAAAVPAPAFYALRGGFSTLTARLRTALGERGVRLASGQPVAAIDRSPTGWVVRTGRETIEADAVVLATPAGPTAALLAPLDAEAAGLLRGIECASVAVVTLRFPAAAVGDDLYGTGLLIPQGTPFVAGPGEVAGAAATRTCLVTACTYLWAKWPHLVHPASKLLRASVGRFGDQRYAALDDDRLVARVVAELTAMLGLAGAPTASLVTRWPDALPQYKVHHLLRVASIEAAATRLGRLAVAGAAYRGVGVPACVASGRAAAREVLAQLAGADTGTRAG